MHDLVHDLVTIITANEFIVLDATEPRTWKTKATKRYCRHAQLINYQKPSEVFKVLPGKVRSLHFRGHTGLLQILPRKALSRLKYIRILDLSGCSIKEQPCPPNKLLPSSIHNLRLLRYLNVSGLPITTLTKSFHQLQNMQTLIMSNCSLQTLPENIGSLLKLHYLDLSGNGNLSKLPTSLGSLLQLVFLNLSGCSKLHELPDSVHKLRCLSHLDMSECRALQMLPDAFGELSKLSFLNLSCCSQLIKLPDNLKLESLEHLNLSGCHELQNLPQELGYLQKLEFLSLSDCYKLQMLPDSFWQLKHLKNLDLSDCHNLRQLPQCFGKLSELNSLNLTSCSMLQSLPESICNMSKLKHFNSSYCVRLEKLPNSFANLKLQILEISGCLSLKYLPDGIGKMTSLTQLLIASGRPEVLDEALNVKKSLKLSACIIHKVDPFFNGECDGLEELGQLTCHTLAVVQLQSIKHPKDAARAKIRDNSELRELYLYWQCGDYTSGVNKNTKMGKLVLENLIPPRTLEYFSLDGYMSKDFPKWMFGMHSYLSDLTVISLSSLTSCDSLPPFGQLPNLRSLALDNIPNIRRIGNEFYGGEGTSKKLRVIVMESMENLEEWWTTRSGKDHDEFLIPNLHLLELKDCPKLKFLPYPPKVLSWNLDNSDEVLPEHGFGRLPSPTAPSWVKIDNCNLSPAIWGRLQHFTTLEHLELLSCSSLGTLPEVIQCLTSLRVIILNSWKCLEVLPEWISHLTSLDELAIQDCPKLTALPEGIKNLPALRILRLEACIGLDILPEWIGQLTSLQKVFILDCPNMKFLPDSMKNLNSLKYIWLDRSCIALEALPEWIGHLASLELLYIKGFPDLTLLPESMNLTTLKELWLHECMGLETLPEAIGKVISLEKIYILNCHNMTRLPETIRNLPALEQLYIWDSPRLVESCQGEDARTISHIPKVTLHDRKFIRGESI